MANRKTPEALHKLRPIVADMLMFVKKKRLYCRKSIANELRINQSYISLARHQSMNSFGGHACPAEAIAKLFQWGRDRGLIVLEKGRHYA